MPDQPAADTRSDDPTPDDAPRRRLGARRRNERLKLAAGAFDRVSTVILGGAVLAPIFQHQALSKPEIVGWVAGAIVLHMAAQWCVSAIRLEE